jgi:hypothetical protein
MMDVPSALGAGKKRKTSAAPGVATATSEEPATKKQRPKMGRPPNNERKSKVKVTNSDDDASS